MYTLIIKGDETTAFAACSARSIEITSIVKHNRFEECIVTTPSYYGTVNMLAAWFCEPLDGTHAAPHGTLMWYGPAMPRNYDTATFFSRAAGVEIDLDQSVTGQGDQ